MNTSVPIVHAGAALLRALAAAAAPAATHQTMDHLRADLSHEMAAKHARLAALLREWRAGRFRERDGDDAAAICRDVRRLCLRHARIAAASPRGFALLVRVLGRVDNLAAGLRAAARAADAASTPLARCERELTPLVADSRRLVEWLSSRHGTRFGELVTSAVEEIRREAQAGSTAPVPLVLESADGGAPVWVPREDTGRWSDVLRNLVRNAVQATEERGDGSTPAVDVRLRPLPPPGGARLEVEDQGVGMTAAQVAGMWQEGGTRHGAGRGQGLTPGKHAFVAQRASLDVASEPGRGTLVCVGLPARDVTFRVPPWWAVPPLAAPALLALLLALGAAWQLRHGEMVTVRIDGEHEVVALDGRGRTLWQRRFSERIQPNWRSQVQTSRPHTDVGVPPLLVRDARGRPLAILVTAPDQGPGRVLALDGQGHERWSRPLRWTAPRTSHAGNLMTAFQASTTWNGSGREVIVLNVRDGNWSSTSIQFLSTEGDSLGAYLHPGHLEFLASADVDGDGRLEIVLNGKNNDAPRESAFWPGPPLPDDAYGECLLTLETPSVSGQAFPGRRWEGQPRAAEDAYLLLPPLEAASFADPKECAIARLVLGRSDAPGGPRHEVSLADGRIYTMDGRLRPLTCTAGDHTPAADLAPARIAAPLLLFQDGRGEAIDLTVERGKP